MTVAPSLPQASPAVNPIGFPFYAGTDGTLSERIAQAAARYTTKFGQAPTVCIVATDDDSGAHTITPGIHIISTPGLKSGFMWLSREIAA